MKKDPFGDNYVNVWPTNVDKYSTVALNKNPFFYS